MGDSRSPALRRRAGAVVEGLVRAETAAAGSGRLPLAARHRRAVVGDPGRVLVDEAEATETAALDVRSLARRTGRRFPAARRAVAGGLTEPAEGARIRAALRVRGPRLVRRTAAAREAAEAAEATASPHQEVADGAVRDQVLQITCREDGVGAAEPTERHHRLPGGNDDRGGGHRVRRRHQIARVAAVRLEEAEELRVQRGAILEEVAAAVGVVGAGGAVPELVGVARVLGRDAAEVALG